MENGVSEIEGDSLHHVGSKRKHGGEGGHAEKKRRVDGAGAVQLPPQVWQHIFRHLPPSALGRLLRVNKLFHKCLTSQTPGPIPGGSRTGRLRIVAADSIWAASRREFDRDLPKPLAEHSELDMWKLIGGKRCQFCKRLPGQNFSPESPWDGGPGPDGVRTVWQFAACMCGSCLVEQSFNESGLLLSSASALISALPCTFLTQNQHVVAASTLQDLQTIPANITVTKHYFKPHVEDIQEQFEDARALGPAAAEEWFKGLEGIGKQRIADAARWERWELRGGRRALSLNASRETSTRASGVGLPQRTASQSQPIAQPKHDRASPASITQPPPKPPAQASPPLEKAQPMAPNQPSTAGRANRNQREVELHKAARKSEIVQRCLTLQPPISQNVLEHMGSFKAAIMIPRPLTDNDWELLKPRLLAQREEAERKASEQVTSAPAEPNPNEDADTRAEREQRQKAESDEAQEALRLKLEAYADEMINRDWNDNTITRDSCPQFAASVLTHVRARFYSDIATEDEERSKAGLPTLEDVPNLPPTRKLLLDHMKYVYTSKIKPKAEAKRKELFLCSQCEGSKYYGFEGVIQHYGAKHTSSFSVGNVIVSWQTAEWPLDPPFHPEPSTVVSTGLNSMQPQGNNAQGYQQGRFGRPSTAGPRMPRNGPRRNTQISPSPYGHHSYTPHAQGPFPPPQHPPPQHAPPPAPAPQGYGQGYPPVPAGYPPAPYGNQYPVPPPPNPYHSYHQGPPPHYGPGNGYYTSGYPPQGMQPQTGYPNGRPMSHYDMARDTPYGYQDRISGAAAYPPQPDPLPQAPSFPPDHWREVADVGARLWTAVTSVDAPQSVRVHVSIFHVALSFKSRFGVEPTPDLFLDVLDKHELMRPMGNVQGLVCKLCSLGTRGKASCTSPTSPRAGENAISYSVLSLLSHFKSIHIERARYAADRVAPSWVEDMVLLPSPDILSEFLHNLRADPETTEYFAMAIRHELSNQRDRVDVEPPLRSVTPGQHRFVEDQRAPLSRGSRTPLMATRSEHGTNGSASPQHHDADVADRADRFLSRLNPEGEDGRRDDRDSQPPHGRTPYDAPGEPQIHAPHSGPSRGPSIEPYPGEPAMHYYESVPRQPYDVYDNRREHPSHVAYDSPERMARSRSRHSARHARYEEIRNRIRGHEEPFRRRSDRSLSPRPRNGHHSPEIVYYRDSRPDHPVGSEKVYRPGYDSHIRVRPMDPYYLDRSGRPALVYVPDPYRPMPSYQPPAGAPDPEYEYLHGPTGVYDDHHRTVLVQERRPYEPRVVRGSDIERERRYYEPEHRRGYEEEDPMQARGESRYVEQQPPPPPPPPQR
ncbi:hypothetical protein BDY21DRAFT_179846 [Lineolata rhizophorae]|uniref:Uncharacterized protein n=1 Tax=Lineolata rhizophorae TaxID=578093 RepID=A0A6A6P7Y8_9PEZI|nr:hypothetical protein BDY21DRAFT_179846 [Lineolata rhizophorae]